MFVCSYFFLLTFITLNIRQSIGNENEQNQKKKTEITTLAYNNNNNYNQ